MTDEKLKFILATNSARAFHPIVQHKLTPIKYINSAIRRTMYAIGSNMYINPAIVIQNFNFCQIGNSIVQRVLPK